MEDYTLEKVREAIPNLRKKGKKMIKNISELGLVIRLGPQGNIALCEAQFKEKIYKTS
jgi:hypothetical protein